MPIEIRELVVKMSINDSDKQSETTKGSSSNKEAIINECMEQVSNFFKSKKER